LIGSLKDLVGFLKGLIRSLKDLKEFLKDVTGFLKDLKDLIQVGFAQTAALRSFLIDGVRTWILARAVFLFLSVVFSLLF